MSAASSDVRVCPSCGAPAGDQPFCAGCGVNLSRVERLPTRAEHDEQASAARATQAPLDAVASARCGRVGVLVGACVVAVAVVGAVAYLLTSGGPDRTYRTPSESMEPSLKIGEVVDVYEQKAPAVGDIVVFAPPAGAEVNRCADRSSGMNTPRPCARATPAQTDVLFIKRIVAGPGDSIAVEDGYVVRNGELVEEPYIKECGLAPECNMPDPISLDDDQWFVLGDNRGRSADSRIWGPVSTDAIVGVVEQ